MLAYQSELAFLPYCERDKRGLSFEPLDAGFSQVVAIEVRNLKSCEVREAVEEGDEVKRQGAGAWLGKLNPGVMLSDKSVAPFIKKGHLEQLLLRRKESGNDGSFEVSERGQERKGCFDLSQP